MGKMAPRQLSVGAAAEVPEQINCRSTSADPFGVARHDTSHQAVIPQAVSISACIGLFLW